MKLHKVVEKVKSQRREAGHVQFLRQPASAGASDGWTAPVYSEARGFDLDETVLRDNRCICYWPDTPELQQYKVLRAQVSRQMKEKGWNAIMITSVRPGEGKSVTSINLALTFAKAYNQTVLLVDSDLRQQSIYRYLGMAGDKGLVDHLLNDTPVKDLIIWPKVEQLTVISGGCTVHDGAELLGSPRMNALVAELKGRYPDRCVLFDAPPLLSGADALTLGTLVDGILVVVEAGKTTYKEVEEGLALIPKEKILGILLNKYSSPNQNYYAYNETSRKR